MQTSEDIDFLKLDFPADFLARYRAGVTMKKSQTVKFTHNEVIFFGATTIAVPHVTPIQIEAIKRIVAGVKLAELVSLLGSAATAETIAYLDRHQLIRPVYQNRFIGTAWEKQVEFFTDFVDDPNAAQDRLASASVCIIGCGGAGNIVVQHLVSAGTQKFVLIDDDRIEQNNFNRQFCFDTEDLGRSKAVALKSYILARNPDAEVHIFCQKITSAADIAHLLETEDLHPHLIIGCADTPPIAIQIFILEYCLEYGVFCTFGGVGIHHGRIGPLLIEPTRISKYLAHKQQQLRIMSELESTAPGTGIISGSISYLNTIISSLIVADVIDLLAGIRTPLSLNTIWKYTWADRMMTKEQEY
jgi:predicted ThiF/HesA family dinucleotide-utilizing enzyme